MPDPAVADASTETQTGVSSNGQVTPIGELDSISEYRARRGEVKTGEDAETVEPPKVEARAEEAKTEEVATEPDPASEAGKALAKKKGSLQGRIDELTREKHQTAGEAAAAKAEAAALKAELEALKAGKAEPKAEPAAAGDDPEPDVTKFDDYGQYVKAQARWEARQEIKAENAAREKQSRERAISDALARVYDNGTKAHEDYNERVLAYEAAGGQYSAAAQDVILHHELGHEFAYRLVTDPSVAARVNGATNPYAAMLEAGAVLAEIKADLKAATEEAKPKPKPVSKAPAPVEPLTGEHAATVPDPANMNSVSEWRKHRQKFMAA